MQIQVQHNLLTFIIIYGFALALESQVLRPYMFDLILDPWVL
jgi:hypothetical protein